MDTAHATLLIDDLRQLAGDEDADPRLLERYRAGDGDAFARLVRRHGPMVLGVCRRVLRHEQDAEDACQATFLTLARRNGAIRRGEALASNLEGRSCADAARQLGCPRGTVLSRLARARQRLAERLRGRDITVPVVVVPAELAQTVGAIGSRLLTGEAAASVVSAGAVDLTLGGGKMSKWLLCPLLGLLATCGLMTVGGANGPRPAKQVAPPAPMKTRVTEQEAALPAKPKAESRLDVVLREWQKANGAVKAARYRFTRTEDDRAFGTQTVTQGVVQVLEPGWFRLDAEGKPAREIWLLTPKTIHRYDRHSKEEHVYSRPEHLPFLGEAKGKQTGQVQRQVTTGDGASRATG
jgi:hypothetical protein